MDGTRTDGPIGIFDSGIGGLSVLRHIRAALPNEDLIYFADSGFAPYGQKPESAILARCQAIAAFLLRHGVKLIVVACNSATAAAIALLRQHYPALPLVGVEPGIKPSTLCTRTGVVGVMATAATISSAKFNALLETTSTQTGVRFILQPCNGLADQIERGELRSPATIRLLKQYVDPLLTTDADTIVLGCTHYPFVRECIEEIVAQSTQRPVQIIDTGEAVARQVVRRLVEADCLNSAAKAGGLQVFTTGSTSSIDTAFVRLLDLSVSCHAVASG